MLVSPIGIGGGINRGILTGRRGIIGAGPGPGGSLQDEVASTCFHLDATDADSYSGSGQTWANLIDTPADGSGQTAFDVWRGASSSASTDDPTFNGTAGDSAAYWSFDGGDFFRCTLSAANQPALWKNMGKSNSDGVFWFAAAIRSGGASATNRLFSTFQSSGNGLKAYGSTFTNFGFVISNAGGGGTNQIVPVTTALSQNTNYLIVCSFDPSSKDLRYAINSKTFSTTNWSGYRTNTTNGTLPMEFDSNGNANAPSSSGVRVYAYAGGNSYIDNTALGKIVDFFNAKHGRTYA
jgi:hypothetical protein